MGIENKRLRIFFGSLVLFRVGVLAVCAFLPPSLPGVWRQTDTLGVALRYWLRWTVEQGVLVPLFPAVLNSGDQSGIMPMEFPVLNLVSAPLFALGPFWGRVLSMLVVLLIVHGLIFLNFKVWKKSAMDSFGFFLMAIATFSSGWTGKFIPDFISVLLVLLGVGWSWTKTSPIKSCLSCGLGILMKPTSIVVMALYLAHPKAWARTKENVIWKNLIWGGVAVVICLAYYTWGVKWIGQYQDGRGFYAIEFRPFFSSLLGFFSDVKNWTNMWMYRPFFSLGVLAILPLSFIAVVQRRRGYHQFLALWAVLIVQYIFIAGLIGPAGFGHDYYFLGLAPTSALIMWWVLSQKWPKWVPIAIFIGILSPTVELSLMDLRALYKPSWRSQLLLSNECNLIKSKHPEASWGSGSVFRSSAEEYPSLGMCFGERQGSNTAPYGFFWKSDPLPSSCKVIETTEMISFVHCS